jgi:hypothetical protein
MYPFTQVLFVSILLISFPMIRMVPGSAADAAPGTSLTPRCRCGKFLLKKGSCSKCGLSRDPTAPWVKTGPKPTDNDPSCWRCQSPVDLSDIGRSKSRGQSLQCKNCRALPDFQKWSKANPQLTAEQLMQSLKKPAPREIRLGTARQPPPQTQEDQEDYDRFQQKSTFQRGRTIPASRSSTYAKPCPNCMCKYSISIRKIYT